MRDAHLRTLFANDPARGERLTLEAAGIYFDYSKNRITEETLDTTRASFYKSRKHDGRVVLVLGALGIHLGLGFADTVIVLVLGNLIGMLLFGCFVLLGQKTGATTLRGCEPGWAASQASSSVARPGGSDTGAPSTSTAAACSGSTPRWRAHRRAGTPQSRASRRTGTRTS